MSSSPWLSVRNWRRFQVYSDRNPPWVKWATAQLDDDELCTLRTETRLFWSLIVLVAARRENVIPNDSAWLAVETSMPKRAVTRALNELVQAGFLLGFESKADCIAADRDAKQADDASRDARTETETETETEGQDRSSRSEITSEPRPDLTESEDQHKDEEEQPFAREPEPELNGAGYDLPTIEQRPNLEPDDSMERLSVPADVEELVERWSGKTP